MYLRLILKQGVFLKMYLQNSKTFLLCAILSCTRGNSNFSLKCSEEEQKVNEEKILWPDTKVYSFAVSRPPCVKQNLELAKRQCLWNGWKKKPICKFLQKDMPKCPEKFTWFENICYTVLDPGPFHKKCPYPNVLPYSEYQGLLKQMVGDYVWVPVQREDNDAIGDYYYVESSTAFGDDFLLNQAEPTQMIVTKQCIVQRYTLTYKLVNCNDSYPKVCAYRDLISSSNFLCKETYPNNYCIQKDYNINSGCICLNTTNAMSVSRNKFCENLAELNHPYQNEVKKILAGVMCWIGLERNNNTYVWSKTKTQLNYTYWSENAYYSYDYGALSESGWFLRPDHSLGCALCENKLQFKQPTLILDYNKKTKIFVLELQFYKSLKVLSQKDNIRAFCFFNSDRFSIKSRYTAFGTHTEKTTALYYFSPHLFGPGYYWCESFHYPNLEQIKSNTMFLHDRSIFGNEYVAELTIKYDDNTNPLEKSVYESFRQYLQNYFYSSKISKISNIVSVRRFQVLNINETSHLIQYLIHITTKFAYLNNREKEFSHLQDELSKAVKGYGGTVEEFLSSDFCFREVTTSYDNVTLFWPTTSIKETVVPKELCLQQNGKPVIRTCKGEFKHGAKWGHVQGRCVRNVPKSEVTDDLQTLLDSEEPNNTVVEILVNITGQYNKFEEVDVFLVGKIFRKMVPIKEVAVENITQIVSHMTKTDRAVLMKSQTNFNATDEILKNYDTILKNSDVMENGSHTLVSTKNVILLKANLKHTNITGIAIFNISGRMEVEVLNSTAEEILGKGSLEALLVLEQDLIDQIKLHSQADDAPLIITSFFQDSLFNDIETDIKTNDGIIFGVLLPPDFDEKFTAPISMFIKPKSSNNLKTCSHWEFGLNYNATIKRSHWLESGNMSIINTTNLIHCEFWHATHFGVLVMTNNKQIDGKVDTILLSIITTTNCIFSLVGLAVIFITSALFKNWRRNTGNQVLINFSLAISLQICLLYASDLVFNRESRSQFCILIGALLHYSVISVFCWMLVIGILQFKRLVIVFGGQTRYILLKSCIVGWVIPTIPVLILLLVSPDSYLKNSGICYPFGMALYIAVLLPIALILVANIIVFSVIIYDICRKGPECSENCDLVLQWRIVVLLYFMLGLTWVFGLLSYVDGGIIFLYLFCFLATLQGFMLFLFFVVFNNNTRNLYITLFKQNYRKYH